VVASVKVRLPDMEFLPRVAFASRGFVSGLREFLAAFFNGVALMPL